MSNKRYGAGGRLLLSHSRGGAGVQKDKDIINKKGKFCVDTNYEVQNNKLRRECYNDI